MFRQDVVTAKDPIGQQNVIGFMVPGIVGEIALGDEPNVPATFGENPIGRSGAESRAEKACHCFSDLDEVVGVDVVKDGRANEL